LAGSPCTSRCPMAEPATTVRRSPLDELRFGVRCAQATHVTARGVAAVLSFCRDEGVELCVARCSANDLAAAQQLERSGFTLTDTLVWYERDLLELPARPHLEGPVLIRSFERGEEGEVAQLASAAFRGYAGHYHADPRLDPGLADEVYADWAGRSCTDPRVADAVLVAELHGSLVGFTTVRLNDADEAEGLLDGVAPAARGLGIFTGLLVERLRWSRAHGAARATVSTQITNLVAQRTWSKLGYLPAHARYTFHRWFDDVLDTSSSRSSTKERMA